MSKSFQSHEITLKLSSSALFNQTFQKRIVKLPIHMPKPFQRATLDLLIKLFLLQWLSEDCSPTILSHQILLAAYVHCMYRPDRLCYVKYPAFKPLGRTRVMNRVKCSGRRVVCFDTNPMHT